MSRKPNLLTLIWALFIMLLCGIPGRDIPHISFLEILSFDKWVHAGVFAVLVIFAIRGFRLQNKFSEIKKQAVFCAVGFSIAYGGILEILQGTLFQDRAADFYDFLANTFGCFVATLIYPKVAKWFPKFNFPLHG